MEKKKETKAIKSPEENKMLEGGFPPEKCSSETDETKQQVQKTDEGEE